MKRQIWNSFLVSVFVFVISSGFAANAQGGSTDRENPQIITSRTVSSSVSSELGDYRESFYSISGGVGNITVDLSAVARNGMNFTVGISGEGVNVSLGPLASGGNDRMTDNVRFENPTGQTLLVTISSSGNANYTLQFGGAVLGRAGDSGGGGSGLRSVTKNVSSELGDYREVNYSLVVTRGDVTIDFSAIASNGMNITVGIQGTEVSESIGPLASGGDDTMSGRVRFHVNSRQTLRVTVTYSGTARYTLSANGSVVSLTER